MVLKSLLSICCGLFFINAVASDLTLQDVEDNIPYLRQLVKEQLNKTGVPGIGYAVVFDDNVIISEGQGVQQVGGHVPIQSSTAFRCASLSKPIAGTCIARMIELNPDFKKYASNPFNTKISDLDPSFKLSDPYVTKEVTIADLMSHRSTLSAHSGDLMEDYGYGREEVLAALQYYTTAPGSFRTRYAYTNFGFSEPGFALTEALYPGKTWDDVCAAILYKELGMQSTSSKNIDFLEKVKNNLAASGHVQDKNGNWIVSNRRDPDPGAPAESVSSSPDDLAQFLRLHLSLGKIGDRTIINSKLMTSLHTPHALTSSNFKSVNDIGSFYGIGWGITKDFDLRLSHSGGFNLGAATFMMMSPINKLGIVVLTNGPPIGVAETIGWDFIDTVLYGKPNFPYDVIFKDVFKGVMSCLYGDSSEFAKPPVNPIPPLDFRKYIGDYKQKIYGIARIRQDKITKHLVMYVGPETRQNIYPLQHYNGNIFLYQPPGENACGLASVEFIMKGNSVIRVVLQHLEAGMDAGLMNVGEGTFTKISNNKGSEGKDKDKDSGKKNDNDNDNDHAHI